MSSVWRQSGAALGVDLPAQRGGTRSRRGDRRRRLRALAQRRRGARFAGRRFCRALAAAPRRAGARDREARFGGLAAGTAAVALWRSCHSRCSFARRSSKSTPCSPGSGVGSVHSVSLMSLTSTRSRGTSGAARRGWYRRGATALQDRRRRHRHAVGRLGGTIARWTAARRASSDAKVAVGKAGPRIAGPERARERPRRKGQQGRPAAGPTPRERGVWGVRALRGASRCVGRRGSRGQVSWRVQARARCRPTPRAGPAPPHPPSVLPPPPVGTGHAPGGPGRVTSRAGASWRSCARDVTAGHRGRWTGGAASAPVPGAYPLLSVSRPCRDRELVTLARACAAPCPARTRAGLASGSRSGRKGRPGSS